jgi:glycerol-3-phosphate acyltransferase PlsY
MKAVLALVLAYLIGSLSFGYLAGRLLKGVDIRQYGSGNTGSTNILRTLGTGPAIVVFILDVGKGLAAVYLAQALNLSPVWIMLSGIAVVAGHNWPVLFNFRGGRGIATSLGVLFGLAPAVMLIALTTGVVIIAVTRYVSLGSIIGAAMVPFLVLAFRLPPAYLFFGTLLSILAIYRHRQNIKRLLSGTESKLGKRVAMDDKRVKK